MTHNTPGCQDNKGFVDVWGEAMIKNLKKSQALARFMVKRTRVMEIIKKDAADR
jgi:hypothetical protein